MSSVPTAPSVAVQPQPSSSPSPPASRPDDSHVTASVVIIGNEILSGRTKDVNLAHIATGLTEIGVRLREVRVIPDVEAAIIETVNALRSRFDYVFTTGGIGPTHDDITAASIAKAFGVPLVLDPAARRLLEAHYHAGQLNEARLRMAHVPQGAALIDNPVSAAPGFRIGNVHVMAGVPRIMQAMFDGLKPGLRGGAVVLSRTVRSDLPEGTFAAELGRLQDRFADVEIGSYPTFKGGVAGVSLVLRAPAPDRLAEAVNQVMTMLRTLGGKAEEEVAL